MVNGTPETRQLAVANATSRVAGNWWCGDGDDSVYPRAARALARRS
jgi:hypothetical protein